VKVSHYEIKALKEVTYKIKGEFSSFAQVIFYDETISREIKNTVFTELK